ncbi:BrnT family toxin [Marivita hallyeonensis]|uniref:Uncharacterized conserved protein, DUF497 family n=1 Tax=Marivita hallyeonensis TaxID=996342 RepID=A0A1M5XWD4_9RHOB|nr:BrnT family toxin [Marivita hallyeonensis]SHI04110.1 Uncharacterized conserved protein, DUF497 family [Marivita hallyeonensis]
MQKFEWDEDKNHINITKHGIDFAVACRIFEGFTLDVEDTRFDYGEVRVKTLGQIEQVAVLLVVHTDRHGTYRLERPTQRNAHAMSKRYKRALILNELAKVPDSDIDYSDIPELGPEFWENAKVTPPRTKPVVSLRLPEDVIEFFQGDDPRGYTQRMAAVLKAYAEAQKSKGP